MWSGTLVLSPPLSQTLPESSTFEASFELLIRRGTGGSVLSISLARPPGLPVPERGASGGLSILLLTLVGRVQVLWRGELLLDTSTDGAPPLDVRQVQLRQLRRPTGLRLAAWELRMGGAAPHLQIRAPLLALSSRPYPHNAITCLRSFLIMQGIHLKTKSYIIIL